LASLTVADLLVVLTADPKGFNRGLEEASSKVEKFGKKMQDVGRGASTYLSLPLAAVGAVATKMALDFDQSMNRIVSLVGVGRDTVNAWRGDVRDLAKETGQSANDLAEAMFFITSAGLRGEKALSALKASAQAATIGLGETKSVAFATVSAMNSYAKAGLDAETAVATLVNTIKAGNLEAASLAPTLGQVLPIAAELGVEFHEVGAAYAAMTRLGASASDSATQLAATLNAILKPSEKAAENAEAYGISLTDLKTTLREEGLLALLEQLKVKTADNERGMAAVFENTRALRGVLQLVGQNAASTRDIFAELAATTKDDLAAALAEAEKGMRERLDVALAKIMDALHTLGNEILPVVIPAIETFADAVGGLTEGFEALNPIVRQTILLFGGVAIAAGPMLSVGGKMLTWLPMLSGGLNKTAAATKGFTLSTAAIPPAASAARFALGALGTGAAIVGAAIVGWKIGGAISNLTGLTKAAANMETPLQVMADVLENNRELLGRTIVRLDDLAGKLGETGLQLQLINAQTKGDAKAVARIQGELLVLANANVQAHAAAREESERQVEAVKNRLTAEEQVAKALHRMRAEEAARVEALKTEVRSKLMSEQEVLDALQAEISLWKDLEAEGISMNQIVGERGTVMDDLAGKADDYGSSMSLGAKDLVKTLKEEGHAELAGALEQIEKMNTSIDLTPGKIIAGFSQAGKSIEAELTGAMDRVVEDYEVEMRGMQDWAAEHPLVWPVEVHLANDIRKEAQDQLDGRVPPDGGRIP
jgi:TP901 family phage tail tape measure protein